MFIKIIIENDMDKIKKVKIFEKLTKTRLIKYKIILKTKTNIDNVIKSISFPVR